MTNNDALEILGKNKWECDTHPILGDDWHNWLNIDDTYTALVQYSIYWESIVAI